MAAANDLTRFARYLDMIVWVKVVFRSAQQDERYERYCCVSMDDNQSVRDFVNQALSLYKIKDVLADIELTEYRQEPVSNTDVSSSQVISVPVVFDENDNIADVCKSRTTVTIFTDAAYPEKVVGNSRPYTITDIITNFVSTRNTEAYILLSKIGTE